MMAREWELYQHLSGDQRAADQLRVLRRRHAVVSVGEAAERTRAPDDGRHAVGQRPRKSRSSASPARSPRPKLAAIRELGVTRLSLGIENFDDHILEINGRAHRSPEVLRVLRVRAVARVSADQHRSHRRHARRDRRELAALHRENDRPRARQRHHLSDGAAVQHDDQQRRAERDRPLSGACRELVDQTPLGRRGVRGAAEAPATRSAARTPRCRNPERTKFIYRDRLWQGADLAGLGVASFGHINGVHMQNLDQWETYSEKIRDGRASAEPRVPARPGRAADPRARPAVEARARAPTVFRRQVRRRYPAAVRGAAALARRGRVPSPRQRASIVALTRAGFCASTHCFHGSFSRNMRASGTRKRAARSRRTECSFRSTSSTRDRGSSCRR